MQQDQEEAVLAAADLVARTGATGFHMGYLRDDPRDPGWYAYAQYQGARITTENHMDPVCAAEALAERLLTGARCACGKIVELRDGGVMVFPGAASPSGEPMPDAAKLIAEVRAGKTCRWTRTGDRWNPGHPLGGGAR